MMKKNKWYESDLFISLVGALAMIAMIVGNYILHGGRLQW